MSAAVDMLAAVRALGGDVKLGSPGRLKVIAPGPLPDELIQQLRAVKPELFTLLAPTTQPVDTWTDAQEERAAIVEYDGGAPRDWADALARLVPDNPPRHVPPQRWLRFIDDCDRFLDCGWADKAAAFGWGPLDLFGCDRKRPFARLDNMGLIWFLNGGTIIELHRDHATIGTRMGARQCYRRRPVEVSRVALAWQLTQ
jgi:hypothetical protein